MVKKEKKRRVCTDLKSCKSMQLSSHGLSFLVGRKKKDFTLLFLLFVLLFQRANDDKNERTENMHEGKRGALRALSL